MTASADADVFLRLAPGVEAVALEDGGLLFASDTLSVRIDGDAARVIKDRVLPLLDGNRSVHDVCTLLSEYPTALLQQRLLELNRAGVLCPKDNTPQPPPVRALLELGLDARAAASFRSSRIVVFGMGALGQSLARCLSELGLGSLVCVCHPAEDSELPQDLARLTTVRRHPLTRVSVRESALGASLLVGSFGRDFEAGQHWINRAAQDLGIPSLFLGLGATAGIIGPLVLPTRTACYMCYRMRAVACRDHGPEAMAYEQHLNARREPRKSSVRSEFPGAAAATAGAGAAVIGRCLAFGDSTNIAGCVTELDLLTLETRRHTVLRDPDCPVCAPKKKVPSWDDQPDLTGLATHAGRVGRLADLMNALVSDHCGVVRRVAVLPKDVGEPHLPIVVRSETANHRLSPKAESKNRQCSGKGWTREAAHIGAVGEAVERYSGACRNPHFLRDASWKELGDQAVDPRRLCLYLPEQYETLPYARFSPDTVLPWVPATSLAHARSRWIPALGVFMEYSARRQEEFLFPITSNGLAAGASLPDAVLRASLEVIERDAFMITWLNRLPCEAFDPATHPAPEIRSLNELSRRRGVELRLLRIATDMPCAVFAGIALQRSGDGPAAVLGIAADMDAASAAGRALLEVAQVRPGLRMRMRSPGAIARLRTLEEDPRRVTTIDDHDLLYAGERRASDLSFLLEGGVQSFRWQTTDRAPPVEALATLSSAVAAAGSELLYVNLTPPDMAELGLYTVRAVLPGFQPIDFGWRERRLAGERLYSLPHLLGFAPAPTTPASLNQNPHPIA